MSFGASPSDIIIVVTFCKALYRKCRDAGGEYDEISREVRALHTVLRHLKYEVEAPESPLNRDRSLWGRQLAPIIGNCDYTLHELDALLQKYGRLSSGNNSSPSSPRALWDRVRFGSNEMDTLGAIRVKLISHKSSLTLFLDTIQLHQSGKMQQKLDNHGGQLDVILDKVDNIAARMGQGNRSIMTNYEDDDKEVWKQFRRELVAEGFSSEVLMQHKDVLRAYIREIDQKGLLDENPHSTIAEGGVNPERWLEAVQSTEYVDKLPPRFSTLGLASDDRGAKEMMVREENMKFPTSMKFERQRPDTQSPIEGRAQLDVPSHDRRPSSNTCRPRQPSPPVPCLITTPSISVSEEKEVVLHNQSSTECDSDPSSSSKQLSRPLGMVIRTSDLLAATRALSLNPGSPLSYRSQSSMYGSSHDHDGHRSMGSRPKKPAAVEYGSSSLSTGAIPIPIPIPIPTPRTSGANLATSPAAFKLAPDSQGNEIPPDAKWTKINRRLVSPEVLQQDGRRYEARPEFVAVLGVLSREEIDGLAARSQELRESRRGQRQNGTREGEAPKQTPRPIAVPIPMPMPSVPRVRFGRDTPSSSSDSSSDSSSSDSESDSYRRRRTRKPRGARSTISSNAGPVSGYPNPFGSPPSPPPTARGDREEREEKDQKRKEDNRREEERDRDRERHATRERESERDRPHRRRHHHSSHHHGSSTSSRHERTSSINPNSNASNRSKGSRRWKENLTAAGIGGAAVSLLNVLSEAAEGL